MAEGKEREGAKKLLFGSCGCCCLDENIDGAHPKLKMSQTNIQSDHVSPHRQSPKHLPASPREKQVHMKSTGICWGMNRSKCAVANAVIKKERVKKKALVLRQKR